jgi:hypothetical protein
MADAALAQVRLGAGQHLTQAEVQSIKSYLGTVAAGFQWEFERFEQHVSEQAADMDEDVRDRYMDDCAETAHELTQHFPTFAWQTTFVAIYTLLEDDMLNIARNLGTHLGISLDPDDLKEKGIFAAKRYLESLCGIAFPEKEHAWQEVVHYNRLRNVIVHCRGRVKPSTNEKKIRSYVRGKKTLNLDNLDRLEITRQFCFEVLANVESLLSALFQLARHKVRETTAQA